MLYVCVCVCFNDQYYLTIVCQKAKRSYQKDVASFEARDSNAQALDGQEGKYKSFQLPLF